MAWTTSDAPRTVSPAAKTPGTLVIHSIDHHVAAAVELHAQFVHQSSCTTWTKPIAISTRSAGKREIGAGPFLHLPALRALRPNRLRSRAVA